MKIHTSKVLTAVSCVVAGATIGLYAQDAPKIVGYTDTPFLPGDKWHVHDPNRPQPKVIIPGTFSTADAPGRPPSDAMVLFDGTDLSKWQAGNGQPSGWIVENGAMMVPPKGTANGGDIMTKDSFGDMQLHIEWSAPAEVKGSGQGRGNSGVLIMGRYELQVIDSFNNPTYPDGQAGAVYGQTPPQVNASRLPGQWQVYDVMWTAPRFKDGQLQSPAYITVIHNGVVVQNHTQVIGAVAHRNLAKYVPHEAASAFRLQDHGDRVRYRNIWVRPLKSVDEA